MQATVTGKYFLKKDLLVLFLRSVRDSKLARNSALK